MAQTYKLMVDGYSYNFTNHDPDLALADPYAEGNASLKFALLDIDGDSEPACGITELPFIGDTLKTLNYYNGAAGDVIIYFNIRATNITFDPMMAQDGNKPFYVVEYSSDGCVNNKIEDFTSDQEVVEIEEPSRWRYCDALVPVENGTPTGQTTLEGQIPASIFRTVTRGSFKLTKLVHKSQLGDFWSDYRALAGKLNNSQILLLGDSLTNSLPFNRGQLRCETLDGGERLGDYRKFKINFGYRLISDYTGNGTVISSDDFNYTLMRNATQGGWKIPVKVQTDGTTAITTNPYPYHYSSLTEFADFIADDYSTEI